MKIKREWKDNRDLFEAIAETLEVIDFRDGEGWTTLIDEENEYGDKGSIEIEYCGRVFMLELHEVL